MGKVVQFDSSTCKAIAADALEALEGVAADWGLVVRSRGGTWGETTFNAKFEFALVSGDGVILDRVRQDFLRYWMNYRGLAEEMLDQQFTWLGHDYTVVGLSPRSTRNAVICERADNGKRYKFSADTIARLLG